MVNKLVRLKRLADSNQSTGHNVDAEIVISAPNPSGAIYNYQIEIRNLWLEGLTKYPNIALDTHVGEHS